MYCLNGNSHYKLRYCGILNIFISLVLVFCFQLNGENIKIRMHQILNKLKNFSRIVDTNVFCLELKSFRRN